MYARIKLVPGWLIGFERVQTGGSVRVLEVLDKGFKTVPSVKDVMNLIVVLTNQ